MILCISKKEDIPELTRISKAAFDTDSAMGNPEAGGPPDYDSASWHLRMQINGNLYTAIQDGTVIGGAILFPNMAQKEVYIGRIFVDPAHFCKGYGIAIIGQIEKVFQGFCCKLDTPVWNVRTNRFYTKLGYQETGRDAGTVYFQKMLSKKVLQTDRLILRRFEQRDAEDLYSYLSDPEVVRFEPYKPMSYKKAVQELQQRISSEEMIAVEDKSSGRLIGNLYLGKRKNNALEIGYIFNRNFWGHGYATESCSAVIDLAFSKGIHRVYAECDPENTASWHLLERLGFIREAHLKQNVYFWTDAAGQPIWKDTYIYGLCSTNSAAVII